MQTYSYRTIYKRWLDADESPIGKIVHAISTKYDELWLENKSNEKRIYYPNDSLILFLDNIPPPKNSVPTYCEVLLGGQKGRLMLNGLRFRYPKND